MRHLVHLAGVSSFRDVTAPLALRSPWDSASSQGTGPHGHVASAPWGHCVCCRTKTGHPMDCGTIPTTGKRTGVFRSRRANQSFPNAGVQSCSTCHLLRPHADRQPKRMASNFVSLLWQRSLDALTSSEFCQALIEGILIAHARRPRAPVANVTEPIWSRVGAWQNVFVRTTLLSSHLSVNNMPCAPAKFETRPLLNQLAPSRPVTVEQFQPRASEPAFFDHDERINLFPTPGVQSRSTCHHLRPHADRQPKRMASNFVSLLWQRSLDALTSSEFCQALIEGILIAHERRPRAPVANVTEPIWSRVGAWQNVFVRTTLLSSHLSVNNMPCAPA